MIKASIISFTLLLSSVVLYGQSDSLNNAAKQLATEWLDKNLADTLKSYKGMGFTTLEEVTEWPLEYEALAGEIMKEETTLKFNDAVKPDIEPKDRALHVSRIDSLKNLRSNFTHDFIGYHFLHTYEHHDSKGVYRKLIGFDFSPKMEITLVEPVGMNERGMEMKTDVGAYYRK